MKFKDIWGIMVEGVRTYAPILFILAASIAFSRVLTLMRVPQSISAWILGNFHNKIVILLVINIFLLIVGMVMDTTPAILILTPILIPIVTAIDMNPIHFGVMMVVNPCNWFRYTTNWSQLICGIILNGYSSDEDRTESNAADYLLPDRITSDHIYSTDQSGTFIKEV